MKIVMTIIIAFWAIGILLVILNWKKDCKEFGIEMLGVPLKDRLQAFFICFVLPVIIALLLSK